MSKPNMGRKTLARSKQIWSRPLCSWNCLCEACKDKDHIKQLLARYGDILIPVPSDNIDWFGEQE